MKTLNEWMSEKGLKGSNFDCETIYDEQLVQSQVADWITKLIGLCNSVPVKKRKAFTESILKEIKNRMLKG